METHLDYALGLIPLVVLCLELDVRFLCSQQALRLFLIPIGV